jgi:hypothetical protein
MKQYGVAWALLATLLLCGATSEASTVGIGVGLDPTGILLISALTEMPLVGSLDLRAEAGVSTKAIEGLMVASGSLIYHRSLPPVDPFAGLGLGVALTPPPFSTGIVVEAIAGIRVVALDPVCLFLQIRFLARWSAAGLTTGPLYEAGVQFRF